VLVLLVVTSIVLITLDTRSGGGGVTGSIRNGAHDVVAPLQSGVNSVVSPISDWFDGVTSSGDLKAENRKLKQQLAEAQGKAALGESALNDDLELKRFNQLPAIASLKAVTAQIVQSSSGNFDTTIDIDKGTDSGIAKDMPVVGAAGLLGRVVEASRRTSTVLLTTDPRSGVSAKAPSGAKGVLNGHEGSDLLTFDFVANGSVVHKNDLIVTSGSTVFPTGVPVGKVVSVRRDPGAVTLSVNVRPFATPERETYVRVLLFRGA
jgi:rod shape-determining protein MreC